MIKEDKANALQSLSIGCWLNGLRMLKPKNEKNYQRQALVRIQWLVDD